MYLPRQFEMHDRAMVPEVMCRRHLASRPEAHASIKATDAKGGDKERMLLEWMERLGL